MSRAEVVLLVFCSKDSRDKNFEKAVNSMDGYTSANLSTKEITTKYPYCGKTLKIYHLIGETNHIKGINISEIRIIEPIKISMDYLCNHIYPNMLG